MIGSGLVLVLAVAVVAVAVILAGIGLLAVVLLRRLKTGLPPASESDSGTDEPARRPQGTPAQQRPQSLQRDVERAWARADAETERLGVVERDLARQRDDLHQRETQLEHAQGDLDTERLEAAARSEDLEERSQELATGHRELRAAREELAAERGAVRDQGLELQGQLDRLAERQRALDGAQEQQREALERIAGLTAEAATEQVLDQARTQARRQAAVLARDIENEARAQAETLARRVVVEAVERVSSAQTAESVVGVIHLDSDEMKGRIIGREGRNIRTFESVTGVNVIIDDTPEAVLISCFDPVRREVGRLTLQRLLDDGRIHPQRIEEAYEQARAEVDAQCRKAGQDALVEVDIDDIDDGLVEVIGRLRYRTSYGQNVLAHLIECAHLGAIMAAELGADVALVKRCAFLHDIGKALTHEAGGSHALVGAELARGHGETEDVVHAIAAHHNEVTPTTVEAVLTQAADTCSASRPGARRESLETYVARMHRIEEIAGAHEGVERVFAMQAGREVRVMVKPDAVDDLGAGVVAREVAKQIETELTYPGQIRVTVVRESRAIEVAR